jgi:phage anti-repressor protein
MVIFLNNVKVIQKNSSLKNLMNETFNSQSFIKNIINIRSVIEKKYSGTILKNREMNSEFQLIFSLFVLSSLEINKNTVIMKKNETLVCPN